MIVSGSFLTAATIFATIGFQVKTIHFLTVCLSQLAYIVVSDQKHNNQNYDSLNWKGLRVRFEFKDKS